MGIGITGPPPRAAAVCKGRRPHALVIPYPGQSHITPMMQLSKHLAFRGFEITFVNTGHNHERLLHSQCSAGVPLPHQFGLDIRLVGLPDELPPEYYNSYEHVSAVYGNVNQVMFKDKVEGLMENLPTVTCLISHHYLNWGQQVADKFRIPHVVYSSTMATLSCLYMQFPLLLSKGYLPIQGNKKRLRENAVPLIPDVPGLVPTISLADLPEFFQIEDTSDPHYDFIDNQFQRICDAKCVLLNTFECLETEAIEALKARIPVYPVGPLLPSSLMGDGTVEYVPDNRVGSALWPEENQCLQWLDTQGTGSVIYISFGSLASLTDLQVQELARGLEASEQPFLWAVRPNAISTPIGDIDGIDGFVSRTKGKGLLVSWAPQLLVLSHPSVGGFFSHCGWNSTLESISMGVPILGCPLIAEQTTNAWFVEHHWKVGFSIKRWEMKAEMVEEKIRALMQEEAGVKARKRCKEWMETAREAMADGGSSLGNLEAFVEDMWKKAQEVHNGENLSLGKFADNS